VQFATRFFSFVCVARIFDRRLSSTLEAGKLLARVNSVKSGVAPWQRGSIDRFPAAIALSLWTNPRQKQQRATLFVSSRTRALLFF
jgi:hypothetical protein